MARVIKDYERKVFDILNEFITDDRNRELVVTKERDIELSDKSADFIRKMKWALIPNTNRVFAVRYEDDWFVCNADNKRYHCELICDSEDWTDIAIGVSLIVMHKKSIVSASEIEVIDSIMGVDEVDRFSFDEINKVFSPHVSYQVDRSFSIVYEEDLIRLICMLEIENREYLTEETRNYLNELLLLTSSRSIAQLIINICHTHDAKLIFLQLYRVLEYLFIIHKAIEMGIEYTVPEHIMVAMLSDNQGFRQSEEQQVIELISKCASRDSKEHYISYLKIHNILNEQSLKQEEALAKYIYRHRCQIAHYKYKQERINDESTLFISNERFAELILSIYKKMDNSITMINEHFETWTHINYEKE